jgi:hypothetical protein
MAPGGAVIKKNIGNALNIKQLTYGVASFQSKSQDEMDTGLKNLERWEYAMVYPNHEDILQNPDPIHFSVIWDYTIFDAQNSKLAMKKNIKQNIFRYVHGGRNLPSSYYKMYANAARTILNIEDTHLPQCSICEKVVSREIEPYSVIDKMFYCEECSKKIK